MTPDVPVVSFQSILRPVQVLRSVQDGTGCRTEMAVTFLGLAWGKFWGHSMKVALGMIEVPRLQAKYGFIMPALWLSSGENSGWYQLGFRFEHERAWMGACAEMTGIGQRGTIAHR